MTTAKSGNDIPASIVVFLVALPLSLGVALASGAPLISGVISGIIGGIVVGLLSGSQTSVSGPAAGLTVIVLGCITQLSFDVFLIAVLLSGIIQIIMGVLKTGMIASYVPSNVIKGLLAAIGIILIFKQLPHAVGYDIDAEEDFSFLQRDNENTFSELLKMVNYITPGAIVISTVSVIILFYWDKTPLKKLKNVPASLFIVILGVALNYLFINFFPYLSIESSHLVNIPQLNIDNPQSYLHLPNLEHIKDYRVITAAFTIAAVGSLETLLNIEAVDRIDPHKRESPPNRELVAQGVGNMMAGLWGGIPITSIIVRSSVNINAGNETKLSAVLHGVFMLISVLTLTHVLNLIPLASLAAILLITGYKLTKVPLFKEMYRKGWHQFIPFVVTIIAIVFTDLLVGVLIGLTVSVFYLMHSNYKNPFTMDKDKLHIGEVVRLELADQVSFLNKPSIKDTLWQVPENSKVIIDATYSDFIDNDVLEIIHDYKTTVAPERNIQLNILGLKEKYELSDHIQFVNVLDKKTQQNLSPAEILNLLKAGNERFINGKWNEKYFRHQVNATSMGQNPMAVIISCIDSRTSPEIIFDAGIGDLLIIRIAGNIISPEIIGSIELSVKKIGAKLILVMGHSNCGAVNGAIQQIREGNIGTVTSKIDKAIAKCGHKHSEIDTNNIHIIKEITWMNVENSISEILEQSSYLKNRFLNNEIGIVSSYYDTSSGKVYYSR
ncbi:MAG: bifunctional SulP family inorganic anion transporter/carbonic anhydrase [Bacteroidetes bacterium]|nr:bifunctional SulP family inorganic anion transporter/carbonic anhydrase [Bacteroidota bacterium]